MAIALEAPDTVHAGEPITGIVRGGRARVFVRRTATWRPNLPMHKELASIVVSGDAPFELPAISGPLTYRGEHVELGWSVVAESLAGRDRAEAPFILVAPRTATYEREAAGGYRDRPTETTTIEPDLGEEHREGPRGTDPNDPFEMFGAWVARTFAAITAPRGGVSDVTFEVTPSRVRVGDELAAKLAFTTRDAVVVESITIQLAVREHFSRARRENEPLIESRVETLTERAQLAPGSHTYEARLRVPEGAPPSFATAGIGVEWFVRARIQIDGRADEANERVIGVVPF